MSVKREMLDHLYREYFNAQDDRNDASKIDTFAGCSTCGQSADHSAQRERLRAANNRLAIIDQLINSYVKFHGGANDH